MDEEQFANTVANLCYKLYASLPKTGKPRSDGSEWTLCACFVQKDTKESLKVVSLATGSKCIGKSKLNSSGTILHDSHAEVLARRGFLRYLYEQIEMLRKTGVSEVFEESSNENGKHSVRKNIEFLFFSSHVPCGDASIIFKDNTEKTGTEPVCRDSIGQVLRGHNSSKRQMGNDSGPESESDGKKFKSLDLESISRQCASDDEHSVSFREKASSTVIDLNQNGEIQDIFRTGAKCVPTERRQDTCAPGVDYHTVGAVRTKPGRGDPTLSVSCSDKLARWNVVGVQGALLTHLIEAPIILKMIVIGGGGPYSKESLLRALVTRFNSKDVSIPVLLHSTIIFMHARYTKLVSSQPAPASIVWCAVSKKPLEIAVDGKKQGATKNCENDFLLVSKKSLFETFITLTGEKFKSKTYFECKLSAEDYQRQWKVRKNQLGAWTEKAPELQCFKVPQS